jgi:hypothetical protein
MEFDIPMCGEDLMFTAYGQGHTKLELWRFLADNKEDTNVVEKSCTTVPSTSHFVHGFLLD